MSASRSSAFHSQIWHSAPPMRSRRRQGKVIVTLVLMLPMLFAVLGLVVDGSRLMSESSILQNAADAGAIAAAMGLSRGEPTATAIQRAMESVQTHQSLASAQVDVHIPPISGIYAGNGDYAEVKITRSILSPFMRVWNKIQSRSISASAIAGREASTAGAAVVVLDPAPPGIDLPPILGITLPTLPSVHLGGLEVLGVGRLSVNGAVLVNTRWSGVDEDGLPAGYGGGLRSAVTCMPLLPLTRLSATDLRVVGGVDNQKYYGPYEAGGDPPLQASRLPVADPLQSLPVPTTGSDPANVNVTNRGGVVMVGLPLLGPPTQLYPGVYDYIQILTGKVVFNKGIYIIRGKNPLTNIPLQIIGGEVKAEGVMFYITNSSNYSATTGAPDAGDGEAAPASTLGTNFPSAVINVGLLGSKFTPLNSPGSPFNGMFIFQRRADRRIMVIARDTLLTNGSFSGTIYSKWGHLVIAGMGSFDTRLVVGSMRFANILDCEIDPTSRLPAAKDVYLVQ